MKRFVLSMTLLFIAEITTTTFAMGQYLHNDGYYYFSGYSQPYTRSYTPGYRYQSCYGYTYSPGYYTYTAYYAPSYTPSYTPPAYTPPVVTQDNYELELAKLAVNRAKHAQFMEAMEKYGGGLPYAPMQPGYSGYGGYNLYGNISYYPPYAGSTRYLDSRLLQGYSQAYQPASQEALMQMQYQLVQQTGVLFKEQTGGFKLQVDAIVGANADLEKTRVNATAAIEMLRILQQGGAPQIKGITFQYSPATGVLQKQGEFANPKDRDELVEQFATVVGGPRDKDGNRLTGKCAACHSGKTTKGGIDLGNYLDPKAFGQENYQKVIRAITWTATDKATWMPRNPDGSLGTKLSDSEIRAFIMLAPGSNN